MYTKIIAFVFAGIALATTSAQASLQLGRSDREELERLQAWRNNPDMPKDTPLARNLEEQIDKATAACGAITSEAEKTNCSQTIAAATKMRETVGKDAATIAAETAAEGEKIDARREKVGPKILKQQKEGLSPAERDMLQKGQEPSDVIERRMKNKAAPGISDERAMAAEAATRTNEQLNPTNKPGALKKLAVKLTTRKK